MFEVVRPVQLHRTCDILMVHKKKAKPDIDGLVHDIRVRASYLSSDIHDMMARRRQIDEANWSSVGVNEHQ